VLDTDGQSRALLEAAGSVDQNNTYVFEVSAQATIESVAKSLSYWSTGNGDDTMVSLWNPADEAQDFLFTLDFAGGDGHYSVPVHLEGRESRDFNISEIIHKGTPDAAGNVIPASIHEGRAEIMGSQGENQHILIAMDSGVYNVQKATCGNTYCKTCQGAEDSWVYEDSFSLTPYRTSQFTFTIQYKSGTTYDYTSTASWSSSNNSVASISGGSASPAGVGSVSFDAFASDVPDYSDDCYSANPDAVCPAVTGQSAGGSGNVGDQTPVITGIDPSDWDAGTTTAVTISGEYFGTNAPTLGFSPGSGISYSLASYNDTQIVASITVASGTPNEDVDVTVTSNGYNGSGFQSGGGSQSRTSAPSNVSVHAPLNSPEITVIAWVNGTEITLPTGENSNLQGDLNSSASCALDVVAWVIGKAKDIITSADRAYASAFLLQHSGNSAPPNSINPVAQLNAGNYRMINDFGNGKGFYKLGTTPNPCAGGIIPSFSAPGQPSQYMGYTNVSPSGETYQIAEGRLGSVGQAVNQTVNGLSTPWIWSAIEFSSSGTPTYSNVAEFPTYSIYANGILVYTYQPTTAATTDFIGRSSSYQLTPSQIQ